MKVKFKNVMWDTDGKSLKSCGLKKNFIVNANIDNNFLSTDSDIDDMLSDWLSDEYGYCHNGFEYEIIPAKVIMSDKAIKTFFVESTKKMLESNDDMVFVLPFAKDDEKEISIELLWEDGYEKDSEEKYIDKNGYGINVCLVQNNCYSIYEWKRLTDTCTMNDDFDSIIHWLKDELKRI